MAIKTLLFDLDGTLLPMDQDQFIKAYVGGLAAKAAPCGYPPEKMTKTLWEGTLAMVRNPGGRTNEAVFWELFENVFGAGSRRDEPVFDDFYHHEFQDVRHVCGFQPLAAELIALLKQQGKQLVLATNPFFPAIATHSRIRWAGLDPADFCHITTYENACHCKPNPDYYRDILQELSLDPSECLMVGNDVEEDMLAADLGMSVFLLTDCLINKKGAPITGYPHGDFPALLAFCKTL